MEKPRDLTSPSSTGDGGAQYERLAYPSETRGGEGLQGLSQTHVVPAQRARAESHVERADPLIASEDGAEVSERLQLRVERLDGRDGLRQWLLERVCDKRRGVPRGVNLVLMRYGSWDTARQHVRELRGFGNEGHGSLAAFSEEERRHPRNLSRFASASSADFELFFD